MKRLLKATAFLLSLVFLLSACAGPQITPNTSKAKVLADNNGRLSAQGTVPNEVDDQLALNIGRFGLDIYQSLYTSEKNLIISPLSLYTALGMLYSGTEGETAKQLAEAMYISEGEDFHAAMRQLQLYLLAEREDTQLFTANSVWLRDSFADLVSQSFLDSNTQNYAARIEALDFNSPTAKDTINSWVKKNTSGLIKKVIEGEIDPLTMMYLVNTVYFKAKWANPFDANATRKQDFHTPTGTVSADMMSKTMHLLSYEDDDLQAVVLPYTDGKTQMIVVLPKDLDDFVKSFKAEELLPMVAKMENRSVVLTMPKVNTATTLKPTEALNALGVTDVFDPKLADLTAISDKAKELELHVSDICHRTVMKIDEEGTEAAAVTAISVGTTSMPVDQMFMTVDHPYFIAVVDNEAGVLFAGSIVDPTK